MSNQTGTIERIAHELGLLLEPLKNKLGDGKFTDFASELGLQLPSSVTTITQVANAASRVVTEAVALAPLIVKLKDAIDDEDSFKITSTGIELISNIAKVVTSVDDLASAINSAASSGGLSPDERSQVETFATEFAKRTVDYLIIEYIDRKCSCVVQSLNLFGLVDNMSVDADAAKSLSVPYRRKKIHYSRFIDVFIDPKEFLKDAFGWGNNDFDGLLLFNRIKAFLDESELNNTLITAPGEPNALEAFFLRFSVNESTTPNGLKIRLRVPAIEDYEHSVRLNEIWSIMLKIAARFDSGLDIDITPPLDIAFAPPSGTATLESSIGLVAEKEEGEMTILGFGEGNGLFLQKANIDVGLKGTWDISSSDVTVEPTLGIGITGGRLILDLSKGDGFIQKIASGVKIDSNIDLGADWSPSDGLHFKGSASIEIAVPTHLSLGPLEIQTLYIKSGIDEEGTIPSEFSGAFSLNLGPLAASVDRIGIKLDTSFPDGGGNLGPLQLDLGFKPPNGVGLSIDAGVIKGGGYLYFDFDKEEYAGALELTFSDYLSLKAIGLITTRMPDGSKGFSLLIIITAEFTIQLGYGFVFLGAGGLLGLYRTMKLQPLADGVRSGATANIMFPTNIVENAPKIISDLRIFFPVEEGKFLIGPMAKLGWGTPTLISISLGIVIEIRVNSSGGIERIAILGVLKCILPDEEAALLVLQVCFIGAIDFQKKNAFFFAAIFESRVLFITIEGEMGVLVAWGDDSNFVVSVGGFHPRFNPPPLPFPVPKRVSLNILNKSWGKIRVQGYFAVTTNTVQLGCKIEIFFGCSDFKIEGHLAFDALFQFNPFYFIIEISGKVSLKVFGFDMFSVTLKFSLEGTSPWRAKGYGKIKILFFSFKARFDKTWGESKNTKLPPISIIPILEDELKNIQNWQAIAPTANNLLVTLREIPESAEETDGTLVLHPVGTIRISQRAIPLKITLDKVGSQKPDDAKKLDFISSGSFVSIKSIKEKFARAQFQNMKDSKKLSSPAFEKEVGGYELSVQDDQTQFGKITVRHVRYELVTIDTAYKVPKIRFFSWLQVMFVHFFANNAASRSSISFRTKLENQPFDDKIEILSGSYTVANTKDNKPFNAESTNFASQASAEEYMNSIISENPLMADAIHTIPNNEVNIQL